MKRFPVFFGSILLVLAGAGCSNPLQILDQRLSPAKDPDYLLAALFANSQKKRYGDTRALVSGQLLDSTGAALANATVTFSSDGSTNSLSIAPTHALSVPTVSTTTDGSGRFAVMMIAATYSASLVTSGGSLLTFSMFVLSDGTSSATGSQVSFVSDRPPLPCGSDLEIAGQWNTYTGSSATVNAYIIISARATGAGSFLTIATASHPFGPYASAYRIAEFDNSANVLYYQNSPNASFNANTFGRIHWTEPKNNVFYYCEAVFGQGTLAAAKANATTVDSSNPAAGGCVGFAWSRMQISTPEAPSVCSAALEIAGHFNGFTGDSATINNEVTVSASLRGIGNFATIAGAGHPFGPYDSFYRIVSFDNSANVLYYQNSPNASFNAGKYGRIHWTEPSSGRYYFCEAVFGKDSLAEAKTDGTAVNSASPGTTGCGGFSWSRMELLAQ